MGFRRAHSGARRPGSDELRVSRDDLPAQRARNSRPVARLLESPLLWAAHDAAHVRGDHCLAAVHIHLRNARGQKPARGNGADSTAGRFAVGAHPGLPVLHGHFFPSAFSRLDARRRMRGDFRDLHQPGLEHGLLLLSVLAQRPARSGRSRGELPAHALAEVLAAGNAVRHAQPHLEHDDVDVGRLVLRRRVRGDFGWRRQYSPAGHRLLPRARDRAKAHRLRRGGCRRRGADHPGL